MAPLFLHTLCKLEREPLASTNQNTRIGVTAKAFLPQGLLQGGKMAKKNRFTQMCGNILELMKSCRSRGQSWSKASHGKMSVRQDVSQARCQSGKMSVRHTYVWTIYIQVFGPCCLLTSLAGPVWSQEACQACQKRRKQWRGATTKAKFEVVICQ